MNFLSVELDAQTFSLIIARHNCATAFRKSMILRNPWYCTHGTFRSAPPSTTCTRGLSPGSIPETVMKRAKERANSMASAGPVVEKVTRTREIPVDELQREETQRMPEFWAYLESLTPDQWTEHIVYLYRIEPKASTYAGESYLEKMAGTIEISPGRVVPMDERGMVEEAIRTKYGGRAFRLICKKGRQRITEGKFVNEAPPRFPELNPQSFQTMPPTNSNDSTAAVATKAIDTLSQNQNPQILTVAIDAISRAASLIGQKPAESDLDRALREVMIKRLVDPPPPPAPPARAEDDIEKAFRAALLTRLTSDPFDSFVRLKEILQPAPTNNLKEMLDFIGSLKTSGLISGMNRGGGVWELAASSVPMLAGAAKEVMHEWRLGMEAQERGVAVMRGANPAPAVRLPPAQLPADNPAPPVQVQPTGEPQVINGDPPLEWVEQKIVDIFRKGETVDSTVAYVLDFLDVSYPSLIPLLLDPPKLDARLKPGEEGLLMLFQNRPVLKQIPVNPRLTEFIKKFVERAQGGPPGPQVVPPTE